MALIDKDALVTKIGALISNGKFKCQQSQEDCDYENYVAWSEHVATCEKILSLIDTLEVKEGELYNNGWIDCTKQMPPETKQTSDTIQGHREWTESDRVLVWDSMYGCGVDATKNGKWMSEQRGGYTGQVVHGIIAWRPIPEFSEELLLKAQKGEKV